MEHQAQSNTEKRRPSVQSQRLGRQISPGRTDRPMEPPKAPTLCHLRKTQKGLSMLRNIQAGNSWRNKNNDHAPPRKRTARRTTKKESERKKSESIKRLVS